MKVRDQQRVDSERKTYVVTFPNEVDYKAVSAFVTSLAGLHRRHGLRGIPTYIFEVEADQRGITHRLGVPRGDEAFIISQLRTLIPSAHAVLEETRNRRPWMYAVELTLTDPKQSLRVDHPDTLVVSLLAGFHPLKADESLLLQWVIALNATQALPSQSKTTWPFGPMFISKEEIALQRKKLEDHTFVAVGRIAARAEDEYTAKKLAQRLIIPLDSARTHGTCFRRRLVSQGALFGRVDSGLVTTLPIVFSTSELAALIAYPIGSPNVPGLPNGRSRHLPAATMIPREGIVAGMSNYPGAERPIALSPASLLMHEWLIGPTGVGKSSLLHNQAAQLMAQGHGLVLIEPKGDLSLDVLASVPKERIHDVVWFDPTDVANPIGWGGIEMSNNICPNCNGQKRIWYEDERDRIMAIACPSCHGTGTVQPKYPKGSTGEKYPALGMSVPNKGVQMNPNHEHKFVIPAEWEDGFYTDGEVWRASATGPLYNHRVYNHRVTKLRCECGEEIKR